MNTASWTSLSQARIRDVQDSMLSMSAWAKESNASDMDTEFLLAPYREFLETLYLRDVPLANLVDRSDLLLHVHGSSASGPTPKVSIFASLLTRTRDVVTSLAKELAGVTAVRVPPLLDMSFVGVAGGSLFIGFSADTAQEGDSTRDAIKRISETCVVVSANGSAKDLALKIDDPAARDKAIAAVRRLSPSGQMGVSQIEILGKQVEQRTALTIETRRNARGIMAQRVSEAPPVTFVGTVREVDLDASRFEIRNVDGQSYDVRCAHELEEDAIKLFMDKRVRVMGIPEYGTRKIVRLLWVDEVELLD